MFDSPDCQISLATPYDHAVLITALMRYAPFASRRIIGLGVVVQADCSSPIGLIHEGKEGPDFSDKAQTPGNGQGVLRHLEEAQAALKGASSPSAAGLLEAIHYTRADLNEGILQAKTSLKGSSMTEIHAHAGLAAGLLVAARGVPDTSSPVTGALMYALRALSENPGTGATQ